MNTLKIMNSKFNGDYIVKSISEKFNIVIEQSEFLSDFKCYNCNITQIKLSDIKFNESCSFSKSHFHQYNSLVFKDLVFKKSCSFEECSFSAKFILEYINFEGLVNFRYANFKNGLSLSRANIEKEINFFKAKGLDNTEKISQETYRVIKYNFEKIGNKIEANTYHALELAKRKIYLDSTFKESLNNISKKCSFTTCVKRTLKLGSKI